MYSCKRSRRHKLESVDRYQAVLLQEQKYKKIKHQFQIISLRAIIGRQSKTKHKSCIRTLDKHTFDKNNFVLLKTQQE